MADRFDPDPYLEAWNKHDWDALVGFLAEDCVYEDVALGERHQGRDDIRNWIGEMTETLSTDFSFESKNAFMAGDDYALEWVFRGTHDRSSPQLPATGKGFEIPGASVGKLEGGLIKENRDYWSIATFLMQVGVMPPPPQP